MAAAAELGCARGAVVLEAWRYVAAPATGAEPEPEPLEGLMAGAAPCAETDPATSRGPGGGCAGPRRRAARTKPTGVGWDGPGTGRRRAEGCVVSPGRGGRSDGGRTGAGLATPQQDEVAPLARAGLPRRGAPRGRPLQQPGASFVSPPRGFPARHADAKPTDGRPPGTALAGPDLGSRGSERRGSLPQRLEIEVQLALGPCLRRGRGRPVGVRQGPRLAWHGCWHLAGLVPR